MRLRFFMANGVIALGVLIGQFALYGQGIPSGAADTKGGKSQKLTDLLALDDLRVVPAPVCSTDLPGNFADADAPTGAGTAATPAECSLGANDVHRIARGLVANNPVPAVVAALSSVPRMQRVQHTVVHVLRFQGAKVSDESWLLCTRAANWACSVPPKGSAPRFFGVRQIGLLYVHVNATGAALFDYYAGVEEKMPVNLKNLLDLLRIAALPGAAQAAAARVPVVYGYGVVDNIAVPSDVTFFAAKSDESGDTMIGNELKIDNESLPWWDVSVGVPVNKLTLLDYNSTNGVFEPKAINKQSVYGLLNLSPWAVIPHLRTNPKLESMLPRPVVGVGLTGRPGDNFMLGGAFGVRWAQFFVGSGFAKHNVPIPNAAAGTPQTRERYGSRLVYGLNIPVGRALEKLSSKAK